MIRLWLNGEDPWYFDNEKLFDDDGFVDLLSIDLGFVLWFFRKISRSPYNMKVGMDLLDRGYKI